MRKILQPELDIIIKNLSYKISNDNFNPNFILGISNSGVYLASKLGEYFSKRMIPIELHRVESENIILKEIYSIIRKLKRGLTKQMYSRNIYFLNGLRKILTEIYKRRSPIILENYPKDKIDSQDKNSKILIVDDNAFTGKTLECLTNFLISKSFKRENIKSCVISSPNGYKPNYYSLEEELSFPWNPIGV